MAVVQIFYQHSNQLQSMKLIAWKAHLCLPPKLLLYAKWRFIMRLSFLSICSILLSSQLLVASVSEAQDISSKKITIELKNESLIVAFKKVEASSHFRFTYVEGLVEPYNHLNLALKTRTVKETLEILLSPTGLTYKVHKNSIGIIKKKQEKQLTASVSDLLKPAIDTLITVRGQVVDSMGQPIPDALVVLEGTNRNVATNENGQFEFKNIGVGNKLNVSLVGYLPSIVFVNNEQFELVVLRLDKSGNTLENVEILSTGYQKIKRLTSTGSYSYVSSELLNRSVTRNVLERIENLSTGVSFRNERDGILIRGRSTIFSNAKPLIVIDNFPYDGAIENINPNDIESITILKDAPAAAIWGARAGNGVIVIETKKGIAQVPKIELNSNVTVVNTPALYKAKQINANEFINIEEELFDRGIYNGLINDLINYSALTPVQQILLNKRNGIISEEDASRELKLLRTNDYRDDLLDYFYRRGVFQQHALSISGASPKTRYYLSAGYDNELSNIVGEKTDRITIRSQNSFTLTKKMQIGASVNYTRNVTQNGNNPGIGIGGLTPPYSDLVGAEGEALPISYVLKDSYTDTAGSGKLLNWKYFPLDEIRHSETKSNRQDIVAAVEMRYQILSPLFIEVKYQFENAIDNSSSLKSEQSYYARDLINRYAQRNSDGTIGFPIPKGGIMDLSGMDMNSHQGRIQVNYDKKWLIKHKLSAIAGWEIKSLVNKSSTSTLYGYSRAGSLVSGNMDYLSSYRQFINGSSASIPYSLSINETADRFISSYFNASYTYDNRLIISGSARNDAANLFGVETNKKGVPLWSLGASWIASNEKFYNLEWLSTLKFRASYGYNGNFSRETSAVATATYSTSRYTGLATASIRTPPNEKLRWEQIRILNFGVDFESKNKILSATVEYYRKTCMDLMATAPLDPTLGNLPVGSSSSVLFGNTANMKGEGFEFEFNSVIIDKKIRWQNSFLFSYVQTKLTKYLMPISKLGNQYLSTQYILPIEGKPLYGVYSYKWAGLDPNNGNPLGFLGKEVTADWTKIYNTTMLDNMIYNGPVQPPYFGALRNTVFWKRVTLSMNISYKGGYYFRRNSVDYVSLFGAKQIHSDFTLRWMKAGDEKNTVVPAMIYNPDVNRNNFYLNSEVLVEKADHIRLEDLNISYTLLNERDSKRLYKQLKLFLYVANLGIIWKANKADVDPYHITGITPGKRFSLGLNLIL